MRARAFNPQIFLELLCYTVFGGLIFYLVSSGAYLSYVTPRMKPYLYFAAIVMLVWACAGFLRLFRPQHKVRCAHCFVLVIPVLLLLLPHKPLSTSDLSGNYIGGNSFFSRSGQGSNAFLQNQISPDNSGVEIIYGSPTAAPEDSSVSDSQAAVSEVEASTDLPGLDSANRKITVANDDFSKWFSEFFMNMEKYKDFTVVMTGYVYKDPESMESDEFVPARLMMSCCVADLAPIGLVCKYDKAAELKKDSWVTVEGTLFIGQYEYNGQKFDEPRLAVTKITPAEEVEGYVYPY